AGVVQYAGKAVAPPGEAPAAAAALAGLLGRAGRPPGVGDTQARFRELVAAVPAYAGLTDAGLTSRQASVYPPEGRLHYGQEGFAGH
ncbi:MAG: hypothetical protein ACRDG4_09525, partial [Chloroflexota bacterium]